jgi:hypothetical protein
MLHLTIYLLLLIIGYRKATLYSAKMTKKLCKKDKLKLTSYMHSMKKELIISRLFYLFAIGILILLLQHQNIALLAQLNAKPLQILWALYITTTAIVITCIQINYANKMSAYELPKTYIHQSFKLTAASCCYMLAMIVVFFGYLNP